MTAVTIRPARADDAPLIRNLERAIVEASLPIVREVRSGTSSKDAVGASVKDALRLVAVAANCSQRSEAGVIGLIALTVRTGSPTQPPYVHVRALAVSASYRRQGIAMRLLQEAEAWTREQGMMRLATNVAEGNHAALAFFLRARYYEERGMMVKQLEESQANSM